VSFLVAVTGKGGVGKTTIAGLLVSRLIARGCIPVLAVDADPNTCLDTALGVSVQKTIGSIREEAREIAGKGMASGISKQQLLEMKIAESLVEAKDFDLIAMGRPEGPGCYCYANNVLKEVLNRIASQYPYVVLDNEAGLENLSRRIIRKVNLLIMAADPSSKGIETLSRLFDLVKEMKIEYDRLAIVVNRLRSPGRGDLYTIKLPARIDELKKQTQADFVVALPHDDRLADHLEQGKPLLDLDQENPVIKHLDKFLDELL